MTARDLALLELDSRTLPRWPAGSISASQRPRAWQRRAAPADPRDLALAEQLVIGVIKNLLRLEHLITHYSGRPLQDISPPLQKILAIALYQLLYLDRIPPSAAVNEAVEQAHRVASRKSAGFVNAVLRKALREMSAAIDAKAATISPPSPEESPAEYARLILSHPPELFARLEKRLGTADALRFCEHDNREAPILVRLGAGVDPAALGSPGVTLMPHEQVGWWVAPARRPQLAAWADAAVAFVQDPTAGLPAGACDIHRGQRILDRCCGLGTKTLQLRQLLGDDGVIVAMDPNAARLAALGRYLADHDLKNIQLFQNAWMSEIARDLPGGQAARFDRILIDVPCSNSGVLARRPEARYHQSSTALRSLIKLQDQLLGDTVPYLVPGGLIIYSTCSVWPEENEQRVAQFLSGRKDFQFVSQQSTLPSLDGSPMRYRDGGFFAVLRRQT